MTAGQPGSPDAGRSTEVSHRLGWQDPGTAEDLADRWVAELDTHAVARAALIASIPGDEASVATAVGRHPSRFAGFFTFNPAAGEVSLRLSRALGEQRLRGICLFPAMHGYKLDDERVREVFASASQHQAAVFAHCGVLTVGVRKKLGLPSPFDLRLGDPLALATTAARYPTVPVIVPHFGGGFFREALMAAEACPSMLFDTSSSNGWIKYTPGLTLADVFKQALAIVGPSRLMFGSDSSFFPRGWRRVIHGAQRAILEEIGAERATVDQIFSGNFDRVFPASN